MPLKLPIAEMFHSVQGEGLYSGTPMTFIRLAGCSVGRAGLPEAPVLKTAKTAWQCQTFDGRCFWCDTDFHKYYEAAAEEILDHVTEGHVCVTGGEPLIHQQRIDALFDLCQLREKKMHLETSGTIAWRKPQEVWMTVSPKFGVLTEMIDQANEIKLLVDKDFPIEKVPGAVFKHPLVYVQPINEELKISAENLRLCYKLLGQQPQWRLSIQLHKVLGVR